ncbi:hypothetical protein BDZ91DRAFT_850331 [Kalaharituber pfeilii]|nr:hypothetical protein BDZ91DRAFT_850331 [Kalaharituber pfeilii]
MLNRLPPELILIIFLELHTKESVASLALTSKYIYFSVYTPYQRQIKHCIWRQRVRWLHPLPYARGPGKVTAKVSVIEKHRHPETDSRFCILGVRYKIIWSGKAVESSDMGPHLVAPDFRLLVDVAGTFLESAEHSLFGVTAYASSSAFCLGSSGFGDQPWFKLFRLLPSGEREEMKVKIKGSSIQRLQSGRTHLWDSARANRKGPTFLDDESILRRFQPAGASLVDFSTGKRTHIFYRGVLHILQLEDRELEPGQTYLISSEHLKDSNGNLPVKDVWWRLSTHGTVSFKQYLSTLKFFLGQAKVDEEEKENLPRILREGLREGWLQEQDVILQMELGLSEEISFVYR